MDAATKVYGVAGDPVAHSLSPLMMNTAFRRENVNAVYLALHATKLTDLLACVRDIPLHGLSVTMPYKQAIIEHLDNTDAVTEKIGACNTVIRAQDGKLYGYNTDVSGVVRPLEQRLHLSGAKVLVVGAGGSARAAVFGLKERGAEVFIINRTTSAGQKLARQARAKFLNRTQMRGLEFDVIVNATPVGMGGAKVSPLSEKELNARILFEMVYTPAETKLGKDGPRQGPAGDHRGGDVRPAGRAAVRDLDRQAGARRRHAAGGDGSPASPRRQRQPQAGRVRTGGFVGRPIIWPTDAVEHAFSLLKRRTIRMSSLRLWLNARPIFLGYRFALRVVRIGINERVHCLFRRRPHEA